MASFEEVTPHQQDEYHQQTQRTDNTLTRQDNYNGFMTQRGHESQNNPKSLTLEYGKTIKLLRNGDEFYRGQKVVINSRKYRYFDVFLDDLSDTMQARFGAVRNIHTPVHGHKVRSLDQIEDGKTYVAAGAGRFVRLNYQDISEGKRPRIPPKRLPALNRPVDYSHIQVPQYDKPGNILIHVYKNGEVLTPPAKVLLPKNTLSSYDAVLNEITYKVQLLNGAVLKLYTLDGELVITPVQLISGHGYVAANKEKFKRCEYLSPQDANHSSPRNARKINSQPIYNSSNPSTSGKSTFSYPGKPYTGWSAQHKDIGRREGSLPPVIGPKPNRNNQRSNNSRLDVDRDEGGIFKAKNKNLNNVKTVQDSNNLYVDMPVDYKKPKEIIDEEFNDQRNRQSLPQNTVAKANSKQPPQQSTYAPINDTKQPYEPPNDQENLTITSINMSDIPTVDSSTSSNYPDAAHDFKIEYNQNHVPFQNNFDINNETYIFGQNEEIQANVTRTLENFDLEETYDVQPLNEDDDQLSEDEQSDSTPHENSGEQIQADDLLEQKIEDLNEGDERAESDDQNIVTETEGLLDELIEQVQSVVPVKSQVNSTSSLKNSLQC